MPASRREFLKGVVVGALGGGLVVPGFSLAGGKISLGPASLPSGTLESAALDALPGKLPLIKRSYRPPNYETPVEYFNAAFTPNNAFFVRWHLANIPQVNAQAWKLKIGGEAVEKPYELTLESLQKDFEPVEVAAVCLCSGNRRGLSDPHVPGVQWGYGAMGNARWKGARLKDILDKAALKKTAVEIAFDGADSGMMSTPDFIKTIPVWKALEENTLIAYHMNGEPLPHWNGYPARVVVPGWTATYWVKQLTSISAVTQPFKGFWMDTAYRIPVGKFPVVDRFLTQETPATTPITEMVVSSLITHPGDGQRFSYGAPVIVKGIAWDGGYGIRIVEVSSDGGKVWREAELEPDLGRYAWRQWSFRFKPEKKGPHTVMAKASNRQGATQTFELIFNPAGYHNNVVQKIAIEVA
jgi:DMSO/TMAO reductase YedYZ molybdopterin-dependent catalytic subunit